MDSLLEESISFLVIPRENQSTKELMESKRRIYFSLSALFDSINLFY